MYFVFYKINVQNFAIAKNFFSNNMVQTLVWLMFNKFKQDCFDVKATYNCFVSFQHLLFMATHTW